MFSIPVARPEDLKEAAKRERMRLIEEERRPRIFNAKKRLIGVDVKALEQQIAEGKAIKEIEQAEKNAYIAKTMRDNEIADHLEYQAMKNKKQLCAEINSFRQVYQRKEDRREFDLYDPDGLKKSLPCRLLDDDPRLSISSVQKFEGEDCSSGDRKRIQIEQQKKWLYQQMEERRQQEKERKLADELYLEALIARDKRAQMLEDMEKECKKRLALATAAYNKALAEEQDNARKMQEMKELEDKQTEIYNNVTSDFLTENPDVARSNLGSNKLIGSLYKGMSAEEKEEIKNTQLKQIEEAKARKEEEMQREKDWEDFTSKLCQSGIMEDKKIARSQRDRLRNIMEQNRQLQLEQKAHQDYLNKIVYTNSATSAFYEQFNKTTR